MKSTTLVLLVLSGVAMPPSTVAQELTVGGLRITGIPDDWTHHHIVFSNPGAEDEAIKNGTHDRWLRIVNDPRYILQQLHRGQPAQGPAAAAVAGLEGQGTAPSPSQISTQPLPTPARGTFAVPSAHTARPVPLSRTRGTRAQQPRNDGGF